MKTFFLISLALLALTLGVVPLVHGGVPSGFQEEIVTSNFSFAMGMDILPDDRILVTIRQGTLKVYTTTGGIAVIDSIDDVTSDVENGFHGIAHHPNWPTDPYIYYLYTRQTLTDTSIAIERRTASGDLSDGTSANLSFSDPHEILLIPNTDGSHNGGTLRFGPDGMLYASIGDDEVLCNGQTPELLSGVILRLDVSGLPAGPGGPPARSSLVAAGNPFIGAGTDKELVYAFGLRNPYRFDIDPATGKLYIADVGLDDWEEINESSGGENFGWPWREGFASAFPAFCGGETPGLTDPVLAYAHDPLGGNAMGGGLVYHPQGGIYDFPAGYDGILFYTEYYQGFWRTLRDSAGTWVPSPPVSGQPTPQDWATDLQFALDMHIGNDGAIYYLWYGHIRRIKWVGGIDVPQEPRVATPLQAVPNPVTRGAGSVVIRLADGAAGVRGAITVYDVRGRTLRTLSVDAPTLRWDLRDREGATVAPGMYYYRFESREGATRAGALTVLP